MPIGKNMAQGFIMPNYTDENGISLPSVTTALKSMESPYLSQWKLKQAITYLTEATREEKGLTTRAAISAVNKTSKEAMELGTWFHEMVEAWFKDGRKVEDLPDQVKTCQMLERNFNEYLLDLGDFEVVASEQEVRGVLYNDRLNKDMRYAGTLDAIIKYRGKIVLLDFKTGKGIYPNHMAQVCAYHRAWAQTIGKPIDQLQVVQVYPYPVDWGTSYQVYSLDQEQEQLGLAMFEACLTNWYINSGRWGNIITV